VSSEHTLTHRQLARAPNPRAACGRAEPGQERRAVSTTAVLTCTPTAPTCMSTPNFLCPRADAPSLTEIALPPPSAGSVPWPHHHLRHAGDTATCFLHTACTLLAHTCTTRSTKPGQPAAAQLALTRASRLGLEPCPAVRPVCSLGPYPRPYRTARGRSHRTACRSPCRPR